MAVTEISRIFVPEIVRVIDRGQNVPYFIVEILITKEQIEQLAKAHLNNSAIYLTGVKVSADNHINVFIDGDAGVTIKDCVDLSRAIEGALDRDKQDFSLDVSSHGATSPLTMPRQYQKHIGRNLEVKLTDGTKTEGELTHVTETGFSLKQETRENKPIGKGKVTVVKQQDIDYINVKEAKIKLKF